MRVGILSIRHESNTFAPTPTTLDHFVRGGDGLHLGDSIVKHYRDAHHEVGGFLEGLEKAGFEAVPIMLTGATPSGTITAEAAEALIDMAMRHLADAGPLDGLLVAPHGAAVSEPYRDFDGHWLTLVRNYFGPDKPIVCTLDPHVNLSQRMIDACNATITYRSNPHIDQRQIGLHAADLMVRTLRGEIRPVQVKVSPPVAISIDRQETTAWPCTDLYALANEIRDRPGVLSNSVVLGFPYADVEEMGSGFIVVTDGDRALAQRYADELAAYLVEHREDFACALMEVDEAISAAVAEPQRVCLLDVGDNVGGGGPADATTLAHALYERRVPDAFVCLFDPEAVEAATKAGVGAELTLSMGGKTDDKHGSPLVAPVRVVSLHDGIFTESEPRHGGRTGYDMGPTVVVRTPTGLTVMLTTHRTPPFSLQQVVSCGLDPESFHVLVAKGVNAPLAAYRPVCPRAIRVNTPGVTGADMTRFTFQHRPRPLFPFETITAGASA